ncbi:hypothetical protein DK45_4493 [Bordetella bronchiseptica]|nr:hypothetical protein DK45_4493 [Bordetella bronchiseptica]
MGLFNTKNPLSNPFLYHIGFMYHVMNPRIRPAYARTWQALRHRWTAFSPVC